MPDRTLNDFEIPDFDISEIIEAVLADNFLASLSDNLNDEIAELIESISAIQV